MARLRSPVRPAVRDRRATRAGGVLARRRSALACFCAVCRLRLAASRLRLDCAPWLHPDCIRIASGLHPDCIRIAPRYCVLISTRLRPDCVPIADCVVAAAAAGAARVRVQRALLGHAALPHHLVPVLHLPVRLRTSAHAAAPRGPCAARVGRAGRGRDAQLVLPADERGAHARRGAPRTATVDELLLPQRRPARRLRRRRQHEGRWQQARRAARQDDRSHQGDAAAQVVVECERLTPLARVRSCACAWDTIL
eukprot:4980705-Prymnesium_polylepis.1